MNDGLWHKNPPRLHSRSGPVQIAGEECAERQDNQRNHHAQWLMIVMPVIVAMPMRSIMSMSRLHDALADIHSR